jgi:voltage-gated potassium channel
VISFVLTFTRLARALITAWRDPYFRSTLAMALMILASGTVFYTTVENFRVIDALYFSVTTLATVGYGDLSPKTDVGKLFTIVFMFVGIGVFVALFTQIAQSVIKAKPAKADDDPDKTP